MIDDSLTGADSNELATVSEVSNTVSVAAGANGLASATFPAGSQVLSGGGITGSFTVMDLVDTTPSGNGWEVQARNESGGPLNLTAVALCLAA